MNFIEWIIALFKVNPPIPIAPQPIPAPETPQQMVLRVCKEQGLTAEQTSDLYKTIHCESNFKNSIVHPNIVNGKVSSTDYGMCQINDYWHIGPGKDFPSVDYVLQNPEKGVTWMAKMCKAGKLNMWVCYQKNMIAHY